MPARTEWAVLELAVVAMITIHAQALPRGAIFVALSPTQQALSPLYDIGAYFFPK